MWTGIDKFQSTVVLEYMQCMCVYDNTSAKKFSSNINIVTVACFQVVKVLKCKGGAYYYRLLYVEYTYI